MVWIKRLHRTGVFLGLVISFFVVFSYFYIFLKPFFIQEIQAAIDKKFVKSEDFKILKSDVDHIKEDAREIKKDAKEIKQDIKFLIKKI